MKLPDCSGIRLGKAFQHSFNQFLIFDASDFADIGSRHFQVSVMRFDVPERFGHSSRDDFPYNNPTRNHREICSQSAFAFKTSENPKIVRQDRQKDLGTQIVNVAWPQLDTSCLRSVVDHMDKQTGKSINELAPRTAITAEAAFEKIAVTVCQCHVAPVAGTDSKGSDDNLSVIYTGVRTRRKTIIKVWGTPVQDPDGNSANLKGFKALIDDKLEINEKPNPGFTHINGRARLLPMIGPLAQ